jgi:hypothetical protein
LSLQPTEQHQIILFLHRSVQQQNSHFLVSFVDRRHLRAPETDLLEFFIFSPTNSTIIVTEFFPEEWPNVVRQQQHIYPFSPTQSSSIMSSSPAMEYFSSPMAFIIQIRNRFLCKNSSRHTNSGTTPWQTAQQQHNTTGAQPSSTDQKQSQRQMSGTPAAPIPNISTSDPSSSRGPEYHSQFFFVYTPVVRQP